MSPDDDDIKDIGDGHLGISRKAILMKFIEKLYQQENIKEICQGDYMIVPVSRIEDWVHDMGVLLGESIKEVLDL